MRIFLSIINENRDTLNQSSKPNYICNQTLVKEMRNTVQNTHINHSKAENSSKLRLPIKVEDKSKTALQAATETFLFPLPNIKINPFTIPSSKATSSFISNDTSEANPTISALRHAIPAHLKQLFPKISNTHQLFDKMHQRKRRDKTITWSS
jgi:hypothetical protein